MEKNNFKALFIHIAICFLAFLIIPYLPDDSAFSFKILGFIILVVILYILSGFFILDSTLRRPFLSVSSVFFVLFFVALFELIGQGAGIYVFVNFSMIELNALLSNINNKFLQSDYNLFITTIMPSILMYIGIVLRRGHDKRR